MTDRPSTVAILKDARELLVTKGWTQGTFARDANGAPANEFDEAATCFCAAGAIFLAAGRMNSPSNAMYAIESTINRPAIALFNDAEGRTLPEVLAKFDEAIAAEELKAT